MTQLSIIIPVYNTEAYLRQCLDSVLADNSFTGEVVCVNDGSTDNSSSICMEYAKLYSNVKLFSQLNAGLSAARNTGIKNATGEYVMFLDSDDYLLPNIIDKILEIIEKHHSEVICTNVSCNGTSALFPINTSIQQCTGSGFMQAFFQQVGTAYPVQAWLYVCERDFLLRNDLFFKEGFLHEDEDFTPRLLMTTKKIELFNVLCQYHRVLRPGSITSMITEKHIKDLVVISRDLTSIIKNKEYVNTLIRSSVFQLYMETWERAVKNGIQPRKIYSGEDVENLMWLSQSKQERRTAYLAKINLLLSIRYYYYKVPLGCRKIINMLLPV